MTTARIKRQFAWVAAAVLMLGAGYTAGYVLAPPERPAISLDLPQVAPTGPIDTPAPEPLAEVVEDA